MANLLDVFTQTAGAPPGARIPSPVRDARCRRFYRRDKDNRQFATVRPLFTVIETMRRPLGAPHLVLARRRQLFSIFSLEFGRAIIYT
jgi:hypothetical protein